MTKVPRYSIGIAGDDPVDHPSHYTHGGIEAIDAIESALGPEGFRAFCRGNAMKYIYRSEHKGDPQTDLAKAIWYLQRIAGDE